MAAAYEQLQNAIREQNYDLASSLMSVRYRERSQSNGYVPSFMTDSNYFPNLGKEAIIRIDQDIGEIRIPIGGKEFWNQYWFISEDGEWHFTGQEGVWTCGLWP